MRRAGGALAVVLALALPATAQARCQVWRALANPEDAVLRDFTLRLDSRHRVELAYLGVADGPAAAGDCELDTGSGDFAIYCTWDVESEAAGGRLVGALRRDIERCLDTRMASQPDTPPGEYGVAMSQRYDLTVERGDDFEASFGLVMFTHQQSADRPESLSVTFEFARYLH
jgi:hypothetical protein